MSAYSNRVDTLIQKTRAREQVLGLRDETCYSRFFLYEQPTAKVVLFFHGFTAVPQQFAPIGQALFQAGYNVLIPLLPGHGQAGEWSRDHPPPLPENPLIYQEFGLNWLEQAQSLGGHVIVGGLSGGSTLAAWLALERATDIDRSLLFAPYLSNTNRVIDWFVEQFNIYFKWQPAPETVNLGYEGFYMPSLRVFLDLGQAVLERATTTPMAPSLIVSSEHDQAVGAEEHQRLFDAALKFQPKCWYHCFDRRFEIPHNMMTIAEGNEYRDLVIAIARAFIESDLTWAEVTAVRDLVNRGVRFEAAIDQLQLASRTSPDLITLLTTV